MAKTRLCPTMWVLNILIQQTNGFQCRLENKTKHVCSFRLLLSEYGFQHLSVTVKHTGCNACCVKRQTDEYITVLGTFKNKLTPLRPTENEADLKV